MKNLIYLLIFLVFILGIILFTYSLNAKNNFLTFISFLAILLLFGLPIYFSINSVFVSFERFEFKEIFFKLLIIFVVVFSIIFFLSLSDVIFSFPLDVLAGLIIYFIISFSFLVLIIAIMYIIYYLISTIKIKKH